MKILFRISLVITLILVPEYLTAQRIEGVVVDKETLVLLSEVHIRVGEGKQGTFTDSKGRYSMELQGIHSNDTITFSHIAYRNVHLTLEALLKADTIFLAPQSNVINPVNVAFKRELKSFVPFKHISSMKKEIHSFEAFSHDSLIIVLGGDMSYEQNGFLTSISQDPSIGDFDFNGDPQGFTRFLTEARKNTWNQTSYNKKVYAYDRFNDRWTELKYKLKPRAYFETHYDSVNEHLYLIGGKTSSPNGRIQRLYHKFERLRLKDGVIEDLGFTPHIASDPELISVDGGFILVGGSNKRDANLKKEYVNSVHLYTIETGTWHRIGSLPSPKETSGVLHQNKLYFFGGDKNEPLASIESFDLTNGRWKKEGELFEPMDEISVVKIDHTVFMYHFGKIITYDLNTKTLKEYPIKIINRKPYLVENQGFIYLFGGYKIESNAPKPLSTSFLIDPKELINTKYSRMAVLN